MSSSAPHDWIGQKLADRYHVTEKIGAGGGGDLGMVDLHVLLDDHEVPHAVRNR
ncbi:MAG: hypothetical protein VX669_16750 [Planctomycetota bacterium]|nr:hypothetical protein [Planctomycetota bacterium]